jgi:hypothetical protein
MTILSRRTLLAWAAATAWAAASCASAAAANPGEMTLSVAIANQLSVRLKDASGADLSSYDFGLVKLNEVTVNTGEIDVDNDSGGLSETFQLSVADAGGNGFLLRTDAGPLAQDEYRLRALFQDQPPPGSAFGEEDILTDSPRTAERGGTNRRFAAPDTGESEDGQGVRDDGRLPHACEVRLWLMLEMPPSTTLSARQENFATVFVSAL